MAERKPVVQAPEEKLTAEQTFFLNVIADHLHSRKTEPPGEALDWESIFTLARIHQLEGIIFQQCKEFVPAQIASYFSQLYASTIFAYSNRVSLLKSIQEKFDRENIPFFTVKGLDVAQFYPRPPLRTMGDLDILIHTWDKRKAHEALMDLGFEFTDKNEQILTYTMRQLEFEVHDHLLYDNQINSKISRDFTEMAWDYTTPMPDSVRCTLDWSFHFIFLLLHLKKHFLVSGVGFRQFLDLAVVANGCELDWAWLERTLKEIELYDFAKVCLSFCERWFQIPMPIHGDLDDAFYLDSTRKVFQNGVFGFQNESNQENKNLQIVRSNGKTISVLRKIFPPYQDVIAAPYYSFVEGRPYLLPLAWIYRFLRAIRFGMFKRGIELLKRVFVNSDVLKERGNYLDRWGL